MRVVLLVAFRGCHHRVRQFFEGQVNEVLCKVIRHNICCLISAMYELGVERPTFAQLGLPVAG